MNALLSLGGWSLIPDLATRHILDFIYKSPPLTRILRLTPATPGSPQYRRHYGYTFGTVVLGYLLYTMIEKARNMPPNFYEILGVSPRVDENGLKAAFRQFAKRNHPDRPGVGQQGQALFIFVRDVYDALKDPATRFAYDRFGPEVLLWKQTCSTPREFLQHGLLASSGYHIVAFLVLLFWSAVGQSSAMSFWRYILFASLLAAELSLILSPTPTSLATRSARLFNAIFPNRVVYQHVLFLHQLFMFISVAITRVAPHLLPADKLNDPVVEQRLLERTASLVGLADREASKLLHTELQSIASPSIPTLDTCAIPREPSFARLEPLTPTTAVEVLRQLAPEMEQIIIEANVKKQGGPLRTAWETAVARAHAKMKSAKQLAEANGLMTPSRTSSQRHDDDDVDGGHSEERGSRETTPTAEYPNPQHTRNGSAQPSTPNDKATTIAVPNTRDTAAYRTPELASREPSPSPFSIKQEERDGPADLFGDSSSYFVIPPDQQNPTPSKVSTPSGIPRSMMKSVPRTPGELPSPRPSPSPPPQTPRVHSQPKFSRASPGPSRLFTSSDASLANGDARAGSTHQQQRRIGSNRPAAESALQYRSFAFPAVRGYFAKGTVHEEVDEEEEELEPVERIRARSMSC